jgi:hypothetical protein
MGDADAACIVELERQLREIYNIDVQGVSVVNKVIQIEQEMDHLQVKFHERSITSAQCAEQQNVFGELLALLKQSPEYDDDETWPDESSYMLDLIQESLDRGLEEGLNSIDSYMKDFEYMLDCFESGLRGGIAKRDVHAISISRDNIRGY